MQTTPRRPSFAIDSEECELLMLLEELHTLPRLSELMGKDVSVLSRRLQRLAERSPVLEKRGGRWQLTPLGAQVAVWTREAISAQRGVLHQQRILRVAGTREFCARVLAPRWNELVGDAGDTRLSILAAEDGVEALLLSGQADLGFDCGRPIDPNVRFHMVVEEAFAVVASPAFLKTHPARRREEVVRLPHLEYRRATAPRLLQLSYEMPNVVATFNDVASIREACCAGLGWAVLPRYAVRRELVARQLRVVPSWPIQPERFGVWWLSSRRDLAPWTKRAEAWLARQDLG